MNLLNQGMDWLEQQMLTSCSSAVEYRRDSDTRTVAAVLGKTDYEVDDASGLRVGSVVWDFLIAAAVLGFEPAVGDVLILDGQQYEVRNLSSQGCWRWTGPNQKTYRIHTQEIGSDV